MFLRITASVLWHFEQLIQRTADRPYVLVKAEVYRTVSQLTGSMQGLKDASATSDNCSVSGGCQKMLHAACA